MKISKAAIVFKPYLKSVIWGGDKICSYKGIAQTEPNIGESWEISAVPGHESVVAEGPYEGLALSELIDRFGADLLGTRVLDKYGPAFPLLIKFIDACDNLSVQVHPDDALAARRHNSLGKTEMWYIVRSEEGARIYAGLNIEMTPDEYVERVAKGTFAETLAAHDSKPGDVFFLPAGRVHAIGAGNLLAEIQESSDITYRIYDYDRRDANGNTRELHTAEAKDAIDYKVYSDYKSPAPADDDSDCMLVDCEHFKTRRILVDGECRLPLCTESFTVVICVEGSLKIDDKELKEGHSALLPALPEEVTLKGKATVLVTRI